MKCLILQKCHVYWSFSEVVNGDKLVLNKLDEQINIIEDNNEDDSEDIDYRKVSIDYQGLIDKDSTIDNILKDLLDLPIKSISKVDAKYVCQRNVTCTVSDVTSPCVCAFHWKKMVKDKMDVPNQLYPIFLVSISILYISWINVF